MRDCCLLGLAVGAALVTGLCVGSSGGGPGEEGETLLEGTTETGVTGYVHVPAGRAATAAARNDGERPEDLFTISRFPLAGGAG